MLQNNIYLVQVPEDTGENNHRYHFHKDWGTTTVSRDDRHGHHKAYGSYF